jgi:hypothetical protein
MISAGTVERGERKRTAAEACWERVCSFLVLLQWVDEFRGHPWGTRGKREPQTTNERRIHLELGGEGKFATKSGGCDEYQVFLEDDSRRRDAH